jgi:hypothetical protein
MQGASHTFVAPLTGADTIRAGCFSATTCSGTVVWTVSDAPAPIPHRALIEAVADEAEVTGDRGALRRSP